MRPRKQMIYKIEKFIWGKITFADITALFFLPYAHK